jgi:hypothetical protein
MEIHVHPLILARISVHREKTALSFAALKSFIIGNIDTLAGKLVFLWLWRAVLDTHALCTMVGESLQMSICRLMSIYFYSWRVEAEACSPDQSHLSCTHVLVVQTEVLCLDV